MKPFSLRKEPHDSMPWVVRRGTYLLACFAQWDEAVQYMRQMGVL